MPHTPQIKIPATYMRGGTSKGVFFRLQDLPEAAQVPGEARDKLLMRVIGSPDPYAKQIDGMGGATSSTSKTVIVGKSTKPEHDVDYLFGQVSIDKPFVDWSGNCGNLSAAIGPYAIANGFIEADRIPQNGTVTVRIWQATCPSRTAKCRKPATSNWMASPSRRPKSSWSSWIRQPKPKAARAARLGTIRCSRPGTWSTNSRCRASVP
jgi:2-methylaconitate cis-trans-isomerase PrpF